MTITKKLTISLLALMLTLGLAACSSAADPEIGDENTWTEAPSVENTGPASSLPSFGKDYKIDFVSGSTSGESSGGNSGSEQPSQPSTPETSKKLHDENFRVFLPWAGVHDGNGNWEYTWVNSSDTNKINQLWKKFIKRVAYANEPFYIRNAKNGNSQANLKSGNDYYLFDNNLDIWHANRMNQTALKKFVAGVIVQYKGGQHEGAYTIGGLYRTYAKTNPASGNWDDEGINIFMGISEGKPTRQSVLNGYKGDLEVIVVNVGKVRVEGGYGPNPKKEYALDIYYSDNQYDAKGLYVGRTWIEDETTYIGQNPKNNYGYKLNRSLFLSEGWYYNKYFYSFVPYWDK
ncbi:hypothetical protein [Brachyspira sp.]|uniref:hypothetical protein n=1 Tax=Brachyspira sp. TaxID=1977261 RepID=UPI003D7EA5A3